MTLAIPVFALLLLAPISAPSAYAADEPDELMPGRSLLIKQDRLVRFVARPAGGSFDLPDAANAPTGVGAFLWLMDLGTPFEQTYFSLFAAGWTRLGNAAAPLGYRYAGSGTPSDPCRVVVVRGTVVKALCKSTSGLTTPLDGDFGIRLEMGINGAKKYCATLGGTEVRNEVGLVKRRNAPPPVVCPFVTGNTGTATSTSTSTTSTSTPFVCPTTTTLGAPNCYTVSPGQCGGICYLGLQCLPNASGECECQGPALCGNNLHYCGGECPVGMTCVQRPAPPECGSQGCECQ